MTSSPYSASTVAVWLHRLSSNTQIVFWIFITRECGADECQMIITDDKICVT